RCTTRPPGDPRKPPSSSSVTPASGATYNRAQRPCRPGLGGQRGVHLAPAALDLQAGPLPDGPEAPPPGSAPLAGRLVRTGRPARSGAADHRVPQRPAGLADPGAGG